MDSNAHKSIDRSTRTQQPQKIGTHTPAYPLYGPANVTECGSNCGKPVLRRLTQSHSRFEGFAVSQLRHLHLQSCRCVGAARSPLWCELHLARLSRALRRATRTSTIWQSSPPTTTTVRDLWGASSGGGVLFFRVCGRCCRTRVANVTRARSCRDCTGRQGPGW